LVGNCADVRHRQLPGVGGTGRGHRLDASAYLRIDSHLRLLDGVHDGGQRDPHLPAGRHLERDRANLHHQELRSAGQPDERHRERCVDDLWSHGDVRVLDWVQPIGVGDANLPGHGDVERRCANLRHCQLRRAHESDQRRGECSFDDLRIDGNVLLLGLIRPLGTRDAKLSV